MVQSQSHAQHQLLSGIEKHIPRRMHRPVNTKSIKLRTRGSGLEGEAGNDRDFFCRSLVSPSDGQAWPPPIGDVCANDP